MKNSVFAALCSLIILLTAALTYSTYRYAIKMNAFMDEAGLVIIKNLSYHKENYLVKYPEEGSDVDMKMVLKESEIDEGFIETFASNHDLTNDYENLTMDGVFSFNDLMQLKVTIEHRVNENNMKLGN